LRQYDAAVDDYSEAIRIDGGYVMAYANRGATYTTMRKFEEAVTDFTHAINLAPEEALPRLNRGIVYFLLGRSREALDDFSRALSMKITRAGRYSQIGVMLVELHEFERAIQYFDIAGRLGDREAKEKASFLRSSLRENQEPEPPDAETERWLSELLRQFGRRSPSAGEDSELGRELRSALRDTPYREIFQSLLRDARTADATGLRARATEAFDAARVAHRDDRPRTCILHLYFALAASTLAGDIQDAATSLGNLGTEFDAIGDYAKALPIQRAAMLLKQQFENSPENVVRSLVLIGSAEYYRGNYDECVASLQKARELSSLPEEWSDLQRKAERALELQRRWRDASQAPIGQPAADCMRDAGRIAAAGDAEGAVISYGRAVAGARMDHDAEVVELQALVQAASLFQQPLNMYAEAAVQAGSAAALAHSMGASGQEASAARIQAQALMETGSFVEACAAFEAGLAALQRRAPSVLELELGIGLAFALYSCDRPNEAGRQVEQTLEGASRVDPGDEVERWYIGSGRLFQRTDHLEVAIRILTAGAERFDALGIADANVAGIYEALARCYFVLNRPEVAISILDRAITCAEQVRDEFGIGWSYLDMAWAYLRMNNADLAEHALEQAEPHVNASGDPGLSDYFYSTGSEVSTLQARRLHATLTLDPDIEVGTVGQVAAIHLLQSKIEEAEGGQDAATARALVDLYRVLGAEYDRAGQFDEARQAYMAALRMVRKWKLTRLRGSVLQDFGVLLARSGRMQSARRIFQVALACKDRYAEGAERLTSLTSLAQADQILQRPLDYYSLASQIETEAVHIPEDERADILIQVAALYEGSGHLAEARRAISPAIVQVRSKGPKERLVIALNTAAQIELADDNLVQAEELGRESIATLEAQRVYIRGEAQPEWEKYALPAVLVLIETLFQSGEARSAEALEVLETAKIRSMFRRYGRWQVQQPAEFPPELRKAEDKILFDLRLHDYVDQMGTPAAREVLLSSEDKVYVQAQEFWESLPAQWHAYGALRQGRPVDLLGLVRGIPLDESPHFIVLFPTEERTLVWHIAPGGSVSSWRSAPMNHSFATGLGQDILTTVARREPLTDAWPDFSRELTGSWLRDVPEGATICFVPSRSMMELPFALLTADDGYLFERNPIACLPSLSLLAYWVGSQHQPR
jgi:tetratricopeptide (TPR) repeat protein